MKNLILFLLVLTGCVAQSKEVGTLNNRDIITTLTELNSTVDSIQGGISNLESSVDAKLELKQNRLNASDTISISNNTVSVITSVPSPTIEKGRVADAYYTYQQMRNSAVDSHNALTIARGANDKTDLLSNKLDNVDVELRELIISNNDTISDTLGLLSNKLDDVDGELRELIVSNNNTISSSLGLLSNDINSISNELEMSISKKQPLLTAGNNIEITNNVISSTLKTADPTNDATAGEVADAKATYDALEKKLNKTGDQYLNGTLTVKKLYMGDEPEEIEVASKGYVNGVVGDWIHEHNTNILSHSERFSQQMTTIRNNFVMKRDMPDYLADYATLSNLTDYATVEQLTNAVGNVQTKIEFNDTISESNGVYGVNLKELALEGTVNGKYAADAKSTQNLLNALWWTYVDLNNQAVRKPLLNTQLYYVSNRINNVEADVSSLDTRVSTLETNEVFVVIPDAYRPYGLAADAKYVYDNFATLWDSTNTLDRSIKRIGAQLNDVNDDISGLQAQIDKKADVGEFRLYNDIVYPSTITTNEAWKVTLGVYDSDWDNEINDNVDLVILQRNEKTSNGNWGIYEIWGGISTKLGLVCKLYLWYNGFRYKEEFAIGDNSEVSDLNLTTPSTYIHGNIRTDSNIYTYEGRYYDDNTVINFNYKFALDSISFSITNELSKKANIVDVPSFGYVDSAVSQLNNQLSGQISGLSGQVANKQDKLTADDRLEIVYYNSTGKTWISIDKDYIIAPNADAADRTKYFADAKETYLALNTKADKSSLDALSIDVNQKANRSELNNYAVKSEVNAALNTKQDVMSGSDTIRIDGATIKAITQAPSSDGENRIADAKETYLALDSLNTKVNNISFDTSDIERSLSFVSNNLINVAQEVNDLSLSVADAHSGIYANSLNISGNAADIAANRKLMVGTIFLSACKDSSKLQALECDGRLMYKYSDAGIYTNLYDHIKMYYDNYLPEDYFQLPELQPITVTNQIYTSLTTTQPKQVVFKYYIRY